ncbi:hypothetical protein BpHYR1_002607 [Brachionus plicatilis]|uniref:Uncharacterized protein n=1 Tax=Brachionus plicatilis TaxID=10195 RepID=A0A3M7S0R8_BRAPC|nr:hypothetical protein BpHYR1_002607 [Brachionus plicatilis]
MQINSRVYCLQKFKNKFFFDPALCKNFSLIILLHPTHPGPRLDMKYRTLFFYLFYLIAHAFKLVAAESWFMSLTGQLCPASLGLAVYLYFVFLFIGVLGVVVVVATIISAKLGMMWLQNVSIARPIERRRHDSKEFDLTQFKRSLIKIKGEEGDAKEDFERALTPRTTTTQKPKWCLVEKENSDYKPRDQDVARRVEMKSQPEGVQTTLGSYHAELNGSRPFQVDNKWPETPRRPAGLFESFNYNEGFTNVSDLNTGIQDNTVIQPVKNSQTEQTPKLIWKRIKLQQTHNGFQKQTTIRLRRDLVGSRRCAPRQLYGEYSQRITNSVAVQGLLLSPQSVLAVDGHEHMVEKVGDLR